MIAQRDWRFLPDTCRSIFARMLICAPFLSLQVVEVLKRAAIDCGCYMVYGQSESYTDLGNAQLLALDAVSAEEARWNKVTFLCCNLAMFGMRT